MNHNLTKRQRDIWNAIEDTTVHMAVPAEELMNVAAFGQVMEALCKIEPQMKDNLLYQEFVKTAAWMRGILTKVVPDADFLLQSLKPNWTAGRQHNHG